MTASEKERWELVRARGRDHYIRYEGLLKMGIPFSLVCTAWAVAAANLGWMRGEPFWRLVVDAGLGLFGFGGLMGIWNWENREKAFNRHREPDDEADTPQGEKPP